MPPAVVAYITQYGYLTIFTLSFFTEAGIPNPLPNELVLLYAGYQSSLGNLNMWLVIATITFADFLGTSILYSLFYYFGRRIMDSRIRWVPRKKIREMSFQLEHGGKWAIYVSRLLPYVRIYTSVAAGLLNITPRVFLPIIFFSALTWGSGYVLAGRLLGQEYQNIVNAVGGWGLAFIAIGIFLFMFIAVPYFLQRWSRKTIPIEEDRDETL